MLLTTVGAFAAFSLMTIAVGTDYWLYSRGVCKIKSTNENETSKKNEEVMTHSGLWRTCCLEAAIESAPVGFAQCACHPGRMAPCRWSSCGGWLRRSSPAVDFRDGSCLGTVSRSEAQTGAALGASALTGGAQQALNAAINLHHGGPESERGSFKGMCKQIDHFPEDADYEADASEYFLRAVRASSIFPILSVILLFMGGLCIAAMRVLQVTPQHHPQRRHPLRLRRDTENEKCPVYGDGRSHGGARRPPGLSNIIGIIVYISANAGDPSKSDSKKNSYSYGWSFYFGALSFIMAEMVGVLAVHMFIDRHRELLLAREGAGPPTTYLKERITITRIPSYRYRYRRRSRSSSRSTDPSHSREASPVGLKAFGTLPSTELSMYTLPKGQTGTPTATYNSTERDHNFLQVHNCIQKDLKDSRRQHREPTHHHLYETNRGTSDT
ncbi:hypothetical protein L3Q82_019988 [Scortum barcoo]|uniref:Uncharacterized protein n=1 Tax=Scortum barcoo TaxID=214431 RepID=A0ACB8VD15_9TELE|nr:hypothetical protein L3Q82_019988 [Scortum barcoo]